MRSPLAACVRAALPILTAGVLASCAGQSSDYPSLAPRPIEQLSLAEPDRPPAPPAVADPAAVARYAPMIETARSADADFRKVLDEERAQLLAGRTAATGSDAWTAAQVSLTRIETARGPVAKVLADLDAARSGDPTQTDTGEAIATQQAFAVVEAIRADEEQRLAALWPRS